MKSASGARQSKPRREWQIGWVEVLLVASLITLGFQLFPGVWSWVVDIVDIRNWTWRSYAVASILWIVVFSAIKAWRDRK
jgi:hypothetical protein